jgi:MFS transporter, ACS family, D-galactonate transporter
MQEESAGSPRRRGEMTRVRWGIVGMAFLGTTINYVDRTNLAVAAPFISDDLKLSSFQTGLVLSGFFWTYAIGQLLAGYLVDRFGARIMYTFSAVWWSVFTAATAIAQGFASLLGFRLLLGIGESPAYRATSRLLVNGSRSKSEGSQPVSTTAVRGQAPPPLRP